MLIFGRISYPKVFACGLLLLILQARGAQRDRDSDAVTTRENIVYGTVNGVDLKLDVYAPSALSGGLSPAVVLIHGGGWENLDKSTMRNMGRFLARFGFVGFAIDYRLLHGNENRWPAQLEDAQRAVRWIRANAPSYNVDPEHLGAFGHSAGAQIAALLGMQDSHAQTDPTLARYSSRVQAVVDVDGPTDFTTENDSEGRAFLARLLGVDYARDPAVWRSASPALMAAKGDAPFLIVHGTRDENVPLSQAEELYTALKAAAVPVTFIKVDDGHTFTTPEARRKLALETLSFFNKYLGANARDH